MPYLGVIRPVLALKYLEGVAEPVLSEEGYSKRDGVVKASHEV
jgi:hypothetical protein